jgi:hypothetical protein
LHLKFNNEGVKSVKREAMGFQQNRSNIAAKGKFIGECEALKDCIFDCSDGKQARFFDSSMKKLSIYVGSKYDMGAELSVLIDDMMEVEIAEPTAYTGTDAGKIKIYELRLAQYVKNQDKLETETRKLYSVILGQCTEYMISKLKAMPTFKMMHTKRDALALLKGIKGLTFMFDGKKEFEMSLVEAVDKFYKIYQGRDMTNIQYRDMFNNALEVIEHYGGTIGVHKQVTAEIIAKETGIPFNEETWMTTYTTAQFKAATDKGQEKVLARMFLARCDKERYGPMLAKLANDQISG